MSCESEGLFLCNQILSSAALSTNCNSKARESHLELLVNYLNIRLQGEDGVKISSNLSTSLLRCWLKLIEGSDLISPKSSQVASILSQNESKLDFTAVGGEDFMQIFYLVKKYFSSSFGHAFCVVLRRVVIDAKDLANSDVSKLIVFCEKELINQNEKKSQPSNNPAIEISAELMGDLSNNDFSKSLTNAKLSSSLVMLVDCLLVRYPSLFKSHLSKWSDWIFTNKFEEFVDERPELLLHFCLASNSGEGIMEKIINTIIYHLKKLLCGVKSNFNLKEYNLENSFIPLDGEDNLEGGNTFHDKNIFSIQLTLNSLQKYTNLFCLFLRHGKMSIDLGKIAKLFIGVFSLQKDSIVKDPMLPLASFDLIKEFFIPQLHLLFLRSSSTMIDRLGKFIHFRPYEHQLVTNLIEILDQNSTEKQTLIFTCVCQLKVAFKDLALDLQEKTFEILVSSPNYQFLHIFLYLEAFEERMWEYVLNECLLATESKEFRLFIRKLLLNTRNPQVLERVIPFLKNILSCNEELSAILHVLVNPQKNPFQTYTVKLPKEKDINFEMNGMICGTSFQPPLEKQTFMEQEKSFCGQGITTLEENIMIERPNQDQNNHDFPEIILD